MYASFIACGTNSLAIEMFNNHVMNSVMSSAVFQQPCRSWIEIRLPSHLTSWLFRWSAFVSRWSLSMVHETSRLVEERHRCPSARRQLVKKVHEVIHTEVSLVCGLWVAEKSVYRWPKFVQVFLLAYCIALRSGCSIMACFFLVTLFELPHCSFGPMTGLIKSHVRLPFTWSYFHQSGTRWNPSHTTAMPVALIRWHWSLPGTLGVRFVDRCRFFKV